MEVSAIRLGEAVKRLTTQQFLVSPRTTSLRIRRLFFPFADETVKEGSNDVASSPVPKVIIDHLNKF